MKDKKPFMIQFVIGVLLIGVGLIIQVDYYSAMLFAMGCGLAFSSIVNTVRIVYWKNPKRQDLYERKKQEAHINSIDERKQYLRMKAGHVTYQIMTFSLLLIGFVLALFRVEAWVIGMIFSFFIFQWAVGTIVYRILEKRMWNL